jgi:hypothetical protein
MVVTAEASLAVFLKFRCHTPTHTRTHARARTHTHAHTHTHTHTHTYPHTPLFTETVALNKNAKKEKRRLRHIGAAMHKALCHSGNQNDENNPAQKQLIAQQGSKISQLEMDSANCCHVFANEMQQKLSQMQNSLTLK